MENPNNGVITISFSADSTCSSISSNHAVSFTERHELLTLFPNKENSWNQQHHYCELPEWMHGHFEYMTIDDKEIVYRDHSSFKTYTIKCLGNHKNQLNHSGGPHEAKFLSFSRTQCGEKQYLCVAINKRSANILEFQIGSKTVQHYSDEYNNDIESICDDQYFDRTRWTTQGRLDNYTASPCPVNGEFFGLIPDAEGLCAKLWSECQSPDIMYYQVSACEYDEVFEGRF